MRTEMAVFFLFFFFFFFFVGTVQTKSGSVWGQNFPKTLGRSGGYIFFFFFFFFFFLEL